MAILPVDAPHGAQNAELTRPASGRLSFRKVPETREQRGKSRVSSRVTATGRQACIRASSRRPHATSHASTSPQRAANRRPSPSAVTREHAGRPTRVTRRPITAVLGARSGSAKVRGEKVFSPPAMMRAGTSLPTPGSGKSGGESPSGTPRLARVDAALDEAVSDRIYNEW